MFHNMYGNNFIFVYTIYKSKQNEYGILNFETLKILATTFT